MLKAFSPQRELDRPSRHGHVAAGKFPTGKRLACGYFFQSPCILHNALAETSLALHMNTASGFASTSRN